MYPVSTGRVSAIEKEDNIQFNESLRLDHGDLRIEWNVTGKEDGVRAKTQRRKEIILIIFRCGFASLREFFLVFLGTMSNMPYFFPFFFIGMFVLVIYTISKMGWNDLVARYPSPPEFTGTRIGVISASVNNANYKNTLILKYNSEGFYLRPVFLLRLFHKPVFIPWKEVKEVRDKKILFVNIKELIIGNPFVAIIRIKKGVFSKVENALNGNYVG